MRQSYCTLKDGGLTMQKTIDKNESTVQVKGDYIHIDRYKYIFIVHFIYLIIHQTKHNGPYSNIKRDMTEDRN